MKRYDAYKDSGIEWLGEVPEHWEVQRIKSLISSSQNGVWGDEPTGGGDDLVCVRVADFDMVRLTVSEEKLTRRSIPPAQQESRLLERGDLLIEKSGGGEKQLVGRVVQHSLTEPAVCSNFVARIVPNRQRADERYLLYSFERLYSVRLNYRSVKQTTGIQNLDADSYFNEVVAVPPLEEQRAIAAFLDRKTGEIDALIERKRRLIALLTEYRTAVISHAVTKGLNPSAPMKDSGVEWIGEVPIQWATTRLKFISPQITVGIVVTPASYYEETGIPCLRSLNVRNHSLSKSDLVFISDQSNDLLNKSKIYKGDLVIVRTGQPGTAAVVDDDFDGCNCIDLIIVRGSAQYNSHFLSYVLNSSIYKRRFSHGSGGSIQQHFNVETAKDLGISLPPLEEQRAIVAFLDRKTGEIDATIQREERLIEQLKEYRTALISEAVTGKIDVCEAAPVLET